MSVIFLSTEVQGAVAQVVKNVCGSDARCIYRLRYKREEAEVAQQSEPCGSCDKLRVCRGETPRSWLFIDDGAENVVVASEDEGVDESTPGDDTGNGLPDHMNGKQHDERPTGSTSGHLDASTGNENEDGMSSSRPTRQRHPPAYLCDYLRTVRETARYSPAEIGCVGWVDTQAGKLWPTCLLLPADVNEEIDSS